MSCSRCVLQARGICLREKSIAGPTGEIGQGRRAAPAQARRVGPALFDEDDARAGSWNSVTAQLNGVDTFKSLKFYSDKVFLLILAVQRVKILKDAIN